MTEEEELEDDAEGGYFQDEDDQNCRKQQLFKVEPLGLSQWLFSVLGGEKK